MSHSEPTVSANFGMLKLLLSISTLALYISSTGLMELSKLPTLLVHFIEHAESDESFTFRDFLSMHYSDNVAQDEDHDRDMELPFKRQYEAVPSLLMPATAPISYEWIFDSTTSGWTKGFPNWDEDLISEVFTSIWQPPKFV